MNTTLKFTWIHVLSVKHNRARDLKVTKKKHVLFGLMGYKMNNGTQRQTVTRSIRAFPDYHHLQTHEVFIAEWPSIAR